MKAASSLQSAGGMEYSWLTEWVHGYLGFVPLWAISTCRLPTLAGQSYRHSGRDGSHVVLVQIAVRFRYG
jgi:hypothetical protein